MPIRGIKLQTNYVTFFRYKVDKTFTSVQVFY